MNIQGIICQPDGEGGTLITIHTAGHITEPEVREKLGTNTTGEPIQAMSAGKDKWLTIKEAAQECGISKASLYKAIETKKLKTYLPPTNTKRYRLVNIRDIRDLMGVN